MQKAIHIKIGELSRGSGTRVCTSSSKSRFSVCVEMAFQKCVTSYNLDGCWTEHKVDAHNLHMTRESSDLTEYCSSNEGIWDICGRPIGLYQGEFRDSAPLRRRLWALRTGIRMVPGGNIGPRSWQTNVIGIINANWINSICWYDLYKWHFVVLSLRNDIQGALSRRRDYSGL